MTSKPDRRPVPEGIRQAVIEEFAATWTTYRSASEAARMIAKRFGVGRTTVMEWARDEGIWPRTQASFAAKLEVENQQLREELRQANRKIVELEQQAEL